MAKYIVILVAVISYLIGSVNFSIMISKAISGKDIRESGSGNAGATNMLRTHGKKMAVITLLLDILKGVVAIVIAKAIGGAFDVDAVTSSYIAGVCVIFGHNFPLYFGFKGGKGVATSLGVVLLLDWRIGLILAVCCIAIMAITRYVSLGSIVGGAAYIVIEIVKAVVTNDFNIIRMVCVVIIGGLLIARHHANIKRLLNGTENKLGAKKE